MRVLAFNNCLSKLSEMDISGFVMFCMRMAGVYSIKAQLSWTVESPTAASSIGNCFPPDTFGAAVRVLQRLCWGGPCRGTYAVTSQWGSCWCVCVCVSGVGKCGKCLNWTSPIHWGYNIQHLPTPVYIVGKKIKNIQNDRVSTGTSQSASWKSAKQDSTNEPVVSL